MAAIWFLTAVTMERACVVYCITRGKQNRITKARTMVVVTCIWTAALLTSFPPLIGWNRYIYEVRSAERFSVLIKLYPRGTCTPARWTT